MATIRIRVDRKTGDVTLDPTCASIDGKEAPVTWVLEDGIREDEPLADRGSFLVVFPDGEVLGLVEIRSRGRGDRVTASAKVSGKRKGLFHYKVAVSLDGVVYADMGCPSVKVQ